MNTYGYNMFRRLKYPRQFVLIFLSMIIVTYFYFCKYDNNSGKTLILNVSKLINRTKSMRQFMRNFNRPGSIIPTEFTVSRKLKYQGLEKDANSWFQVKNKLNYDEKECFSILNKNKSSIKIAERIQNTTIFQKTSTYKWILNATKDCEYFKNIRGYWTGKVTKEEHEFPIGYSILVYKNIEQVERLLRTIYRPSNAYCIHIDRNAKFSLKLEIKMISDCFSNVFTCTKCEHISWGRYSIVEAEMECWRTLYGSKVPWKYLINLTGQEFPLKTNRQLVKILKALNGTNNIAYSGPNWYFRSEIAFSAPKPPLNMTVYKGSTHMGLSRAYVEYLLYNTDAKIWFEWCKNVAIPDERCFSSPNYNRHLKAPGSFIGDPDKIPPVWWVMRHKLWKRKGVAKKCHGTWLRDICNVGIGDLPRIVRSEKLFLNKINLEEQPIAYHCLEVWLRDLEKSDSNFDVSFYKEISARRSFDTVTVTKEERKTKRKKRKKKATKMGSNKKKKYVYSRPANLRQRIS